MDKLLEIEKTKSRVFSKLLNIWLSWKKFKKEKESIIRAEPGERSPDVERLSSSKDHETPGKL